jgi:toxin-antitoxin system PIN domain toxin
MRALLDVNVLVALLDANHVHHTRAVNWLSSNLEAGWASCQATVLGCVRIMSLPAYPNAQPPAHVAQRLQAAMAQPQHRFWPQADDLLADGVLDWSRVLSGRQLPDLALLALARANRGRLVTLDASIPHRALGKDAARHLLVLP